MTQDIPLEASETLDFTPPALAKLKPRPCFVLRAATTREKRWMRRILREEGAAQHPIEALRAEMLLALKPLWGEDAYAENAAKLEAYWAASDEFALQLPELRTEYDQRVSALREAGKSKEADALEPPKFEYDAEDEERVRQLEIDVAKHHRPLAKMRADNAHAAEIGELAMVAVVIEDWTGLTLAPALDRGYLTLECIEQLKDELATLDERAKVADDKPGSWLQLFLECTKRMFLDEDMEKNSASPSQSEAPPPNSRSGSAKEGGPSPASTASSSTIPAPV